MKTLVLRCIRWAAHHGLTHIIIALTRRQARRQAHHTVVVYSIVLSLCGLVIPEVRAEDYWANTYGGPGDDFIYYINYYNNL